uniref:Transmembrane and coiled-coil domain family 1 n=1 Tax=Salvator merianae TaxID=96440 RepID=A0A8D0BCT4_SALMN
MEPSSGDLLYDDPDFGSKSQDPETKKQQESEQKLSKITHNALENINVIGQGLKHLFQHQRRRSSVSPHDVQQAQGDMEPELELENQSTCGEIDGVSTHPTALNRVLQQIRVPPKMKRGTSLHSRRSKAEPPKGSPQINRKSVQDIHSGRPRSSSTTDAPSNLLVLEMALPVCLAGEEVTSSERLYSGHFMGDINILQNHPWCWAKEQVWAHALIDPVTFRKEGRCIFNFL